MGLFRCIQITLLMLRHNPTQELLADIHMVSQSTISRVVAVYTPLIAELLQAWIPQVEDLDPDPPVHHRRHSGALLVMVEASRTVLRKAPHDEGGSAGGRTPRLDLKTISGQFS